MGLHMGLHMGLQMGFPRERRTSDGRIIAITVRVRQVGATTRHALGPNATMPRLEFKRLAH